MKVLTAILIYAPIDSKINEPIPKVMAKSNLPFFLRTRPHLAETLVVHVYSTATYLPQYIYMYMQYLQYYRV